VGFVVISAASLTARVLVAGVGEQGDEGDCTDTLDGCAFGCHVGQGCELAECMHVRSKNRNVFVSRRR
jgi:hypothetical protein